MADAARDRSQRHVQIRVDSGSLRGHLMTSPVVRTLDDLNLVSRNFMTLHEPDVLQGMWALGEGPLAVRKSSIFFLTELGPPPPMRGTRSDVPRCFRSPVRLWLPEMSIDGFVHVPAGGTAMARLNQMTHPFLALTSASVVGQDVHFAAAFIAVSRSHILGAQEIRQAEEEPAGTLVSESVEPTP